MIKNVNNLLLLTVVLMSSQFTAAAQDKDLTTDELVAKCKSLEDDNPSIAISIANQIIASVNQFNDPFNYGQAIGCLGWALAVLDQPKESREAAYQLEKITNDMNESSESVTLMRRSGSIYHRIGDRISAADNYEAAMIVAEKLKLELEKIPIMVNLGVLYSEIRAHEKAIENYYSALELMTELDDFRYKPPVLFNLAVTLKGQKRYDESIKIYHQAEELINEHWPKQRIGQVFYGLGTAYAGVEKYQLARDYLEKTLATFDEKSDDTVFTFSARVFDALVKVKLGDTSGALILADQAHQYYLKPENESSLISADNPLNTLAYLYEALDQPAKALAVYKFARDVEEKFQRSFNKKTMAQMQARLSDSQQREELALLKNQNNLNQIELNKTAYQRTLMTLMIVFLLLVFIFIWFWQNRTKKQLLNLSIRDPLTQLINRRGIMHWNQQKKMPELPKQRFLWLINIDYFRKINEEYGHDAGDSVLKKIAEELFTMTNEDRCLGRWSGEEFLMITQDLSLSEIDGFSKELLSKIQNTEIMHGINTIHITASLGVSLVKDRSNQIWNRSISQADKALYVAKDRGKNCMALATDF